MLIALTALTLAAACRAAPLEAYGRLPSMEQVCLSPDGGRIAWIRTAGEDRIIEARSLADDKVLLGLRIGSAKVRSVEWADDNHLMVVASTTTVPEGLIGYESEWRQLLVFDVAKKRVSAIPDDFKMVGRFGRTAGLERLRPINTITGRVMVRRVGGHTVLFFHTVFVTNRTLLGLMDADLDSANESVIQVGPADSQGWLVDADGELVARQDYSEEEQRWSLLTLRDKKWQQVTAVKASIESPHLLGFGPTTDTLLMQVGGEHGATVWKPLSLKDGSLGSPMAEALDTPIEERLTGRLIGGSRWDDYHTYRFLEPTIQARWESIVQAFKDDHVGFVSASDDLRKIIVLVDGPKLGYHYELVDFDTHQSHQIGDVYEGITQPLEVRRIDYPAGDNLTIPAYLTLPRGRPAQNLPLVVLVHGGPAWRDTAEFDWWSQALADQGYAVLRPNYRGSTINASFMAAGFGQFGRKMQTDLSDGVRYLVKEGVADAARVCIVGASYGGYAALAGVTLDPGVYRCAVSVAGLSDLKQMLKWVNNKQGERNNRAQRFWDRYMGVSGPDDPVLTEISPIKHIDAVTVPILLIHGKDDTVVPYDQSDDMYDALRHAKKVVEFVKLKHEDHWLSRSETRLKMLQATVAFLRKHNPPDQQ